MSTDKTYNMGCNCGKRQLYCDGNCNSPEKSSSGEWFIIMIIVIIVGTVIFFIFN